MDESTTRRRIAQKVRDQLEQALFSLPRSGQTTSIELSIEEAIEIALELEMMPRRRRGDSAGGIVILGTDPKRP